MARQRTVDNKPSHAWRDGRYNCGCDACGDWRAKRVKPGSIVVPATLDPLRMRPGTTPAWSPGKWETTGWKFRMEDHGITHGTVLGYVNEDDKKNGGHLDCVVLMCCDGRVLVTSKKWLCVIG